MRPWKAVRSEHCTLNIVVSIKGGIVTYRFAIVAAAVPGAKGYSRHSCLQFYEYYFGLRALANVYAQASNYMVESQLAPGKQITFTALYVVVDYADFCKPSWLRMRSTR